ncbi:MULTISPECIES: hypothetical protein [Luteimonas]|uniref:hypothetical protein n=1 Tax=Luteimonas TaxID=83614 RepID=UPI000C7DD34E|nr:MULTISPECIES: hypothetical protein [Luteimonas]
MHADTSEVLLLLSQLPVLVPTLIGLGIALALVAQRRATLGAAGRLGLLGFGLIALTTLASSLFYWLMQVLLLRGHLPPDLMQLTFTAGGIAFSVLTAAGFVLVALAITRRPPG